MAQDSKTPARNAPQSCEGERLAGRLPGLLLEAEKSRAYFMKGVHGPAVSVRAKASGQFRPYQVGDQRRDHRLAPIPPSAIRPSCARWNGKPRRLCGFTAMRRSR